MDAQALLADLDERQRAAVVTPSTLVAVIAAAGSGKTRVLTRRIAYRIADGTADARHTLALTFTREAAGELRRRLRRLGLRDHVEAGTFHSVALGVLQPAVGRHRPPSADRSSPSRERLHRRAGRAVGRWPTWRRSATWAAARGVAADAYAAAARAANRRRALPAARIAEALGAYETLKRRRGVIDLDDLLLAARPRADARRRVRRRACGGGSATCWSTRPRTSTRCSTGCSAQLAGERRDLYLVGDPAQAIYGFNGSDPTLLRRRRPAPARRRGHPPARRTTAARRRSSPPAATPSAASATTTTHGRSRADGTPVVHRRPPTTSTHEAAAGGHVVRSLTSVAAPGRARRRRAGPDAPAARTASTAPSPAPACRSRREWLVPGSPLAAAVERRRRCRRRRGCGAGPTTCSRARRRRTAPVDEASVAERRVAAAVLEFLRDQPFGDGVGAARLARRHQPVHRRHRGRRRRAARRSTPPRGASGRPSW